MKRRRSLTFWDYLIWIGIALILGWALLKSLGVIQSTVWIEMIPFYGIGISAIGAAYKIGKIMRGIEYTAQRVNDLARIEKRFDDVEKTHKLCIEGKLNRSPYRKK